FRHIVVHEPAADFFHRDTLRLLRQMLDVVDAHPRTPPELLGAKGRDVNEQETALNWRQWLRRNDRSLRCLGYLGRDLVHRCYSVTRRPSGSDRSGRSGRSGRPGGGRVGLPTLPTFPTFMLSGDVDLDRPRFGFLAQREPHGENAVLVLGRDTVGVDGLR